MNKSAIVRIVIWSVVAMLLSAFLVSALTFDILGSLSEYFNFGSKLVHYDEKDYNKGNFTTADDINTFQIYWMNRQDAIFHPITHRVIIFYIVIGRFLRLNYTAVVK